MEITVYGTRSGAFCNAARQLLDNHGITFVSVLMDNDGKLRSSVRSISVVIVTYAILLSQVD
jgi:glutaredoxin